MDNLKEKIHQAGLNVSDGTAVNGSSGICGNCIVCTPGGILAN